MCIYINSVGLSKCYLNKRFVLNANVLSESINLNDAAGVLPKS